MTMNISFTRDDQISHEKKFTKERFSFKADGNIFMWSRDMDLQWLNDHKRKSQFTQRDSERVINYANNWSLKIN